MAESLPSILATKRKDIVELRNMKKIDFVQMIKKNYPLFELEASLKVDGFGARFGKDKNGNFFFESSRSGPIQRSNAFSEYVRNKGGNEERMKRALLYDKLYEELKSSSLAMSLPTNCKVVCEMLYNDMAIDCGDNLKFVNIEYPKNRLGTKLTIFPIKFLNCDGQEINYVNSIFEKQTEEIKVISPSFGTFELYKEYREIVKDIMSIETKILEDKSLSTMFKRDEYNDCIHKVRRNLEIYLFTIFRNFGKFVISHINEGYVVKVGNYTFKLLERNYGK